MGEAAARLVAASGYVNAGTIEFLLDAKGNFYFMEVNTRLQVEHPVTEMVTGLDLVELQLRVAAGEKLTVSQEDIHPKGHAIECRVCIEDVYNNFLPEAGAVEYLEMPSGEGVRNDSGLYDGYVSSVHYDPMLAKLIVHGDTREEAIDKTIAALDSFHLHGLRTTIPFCRVVLNSEPFRSGNYSTFYVAEHWKNELPPRLAAIAGAVAAWARHDVSHTKKPIFPAISKWAMQ